METLFTASSQTTQCGQAAEVAVDKIYRISEASNGDAANTTLPDASIDIVTAAQAFHWFDPEPTKREFKRIIKPGGYAALIWNLRQLDTTPFLREYEKFILDNANDYAAVRHDNITEREIAAIF